MGRLPLKMRSPRPRYSYLFHSLPVLGYPTKQKFDTCFHVPRVRIRDRPSETEKQPQVVFPGMRSPRGLGIDLARSFRHTVKRQFRRALSIHRTTHSYLFASLSSRKYHRCCHLGKSAWQISPNIPFHIRHVFEFSLSILQTPHTLMNVNV